MGNAGLRLSRITVVAILCIATWCVVASCATPGLVYAKLQSDAAVYMAQARHLWMSGSANHIVLGDGLEPIIYSPLPAYFRAPVFALSSDPAVVVRLIQLQNILTLVVLGWVSSLYLGARLPNHISKTWLAVPWLSLTLTYNPWVINLALPLADHLYALLTISVLLIATDRGLAQKPFGYKRGMTIAVLIALGAVHKFTSLALIPALAWSQGTMRSHARQHMLLRRALPLITIALSAWIGRDLFGNYIQGALRHYLNDRPAIDIARNTITNLFFSALPNQIIPNFSYLFRRNDALTHAVLYDEISAENAAPALCGMAISCLILAGAWRRRHDMASEILFALFVIPIYAIVSNSTSRYLASTQPVYLAWFVSGLYGLRLGRLSRIVPEFCKWLKGSLILSLAIIAYIEIPNALHSFTTRRISSIADSKMFFLSLSDHFEKGQIKLASFLSFGTDSFLLDQHDDGRWYGIMGAKYISRTKVVSHLCARHVVYAALTCDIRNCDRLATTMDTERTSTPLEDVTFKLIYSDHGNWGRFEISQLLFQGAHSCPNGE